MNYTQEHILIDEITEDLVLTRGGGAALILQAGAVNFGLLSEREQIGIVEVFAQTLNSLSFSIQLVIHSRRMDLTSYLILLNEAQRKQANPLLQNMMSNYKQFIQTLVKENEVLDKKFYIVLSLNPYELGLGYVKAEERITKIKAVLNPRRDQIIRQFNRVGIKTSQLKNPELLKLFYEIYNLPTDAAPLQIEIAPVQLAQPQVITNQPNPQNPPPVQPSSQPTATPITDYAAAKSRNHPFVVEELSDSV